MTNSLHHSWFLAIGLRDICVGAVYASSHTTALMGKPGQQSQVKQAPDALPRPERVHVVSRYPFGLCRSGVVFYRAL